MENTTVSQTSQTLTLEETIKKVLKNKTIFDRFLEEITNNVLKNRDTFVRSIAKNNKVLTTLGVAYVNNWVIKCKNNGDYIEAQKAYISCTGEVFPSKNEFEERYFNDECFD